MENTGPIMSEAAKRKSVSAQQVVNEVMTSAAAAGGGAAASSTEQQLASDGLSDKAESRRSAILQKFSPKLIKNILELLCDESVGAQLYAAAV